MYFRVNYRWLDETPENVTTHTEEMMKDRLFASLDDSLDEKVQKAEVIGRRNTWLAEGFDKYDTDGDGELTRVEFAAAQKDRPRRNMRAGVNEFGDIEEGAGEEKKDKEADMTSLETESQAGLQ